ncbi:phage tail tape measure protein [Clostridium ihumii]|uniref:phage tail tape measure protein n=1 Tax=Clostridium ihumii TaxID=1470356 RepID=UPI000688652D|nr:phage tail tape measure protein [Clostridium ihumii]
MAHMFDAIIRLKDEFSGVIQNVTENMSHFQKQTNYVARDTQKVGKTLENIGGNLTKSVTMPLVGIGAVATKIGMDFEESMSNVQALSGANAQQMEQLEKAARDAGAATSKSAKDSADALGYMALAGWDVQTSMDALMPTLRLSEAGNLELGRTSDLVTDSYSSLGLSIENIKDVLPDYLDKVAKTSASSNTNIDALMEGMIVAGGTFNNLNVPLEESCALMGVLANRGTKGSEAGNALNSIMVNLTTGAGQAGEAMETLNLSAFDSEGKFKGMANVLLELKDKTKDMTEEQRNLVLAQIGGKTQLDTLQKLLAGVGEEYGELSGKITDSKGSLENMAIIMQENTKGAVTRLKSALEELGLKIWDNLKEPIDKAVEVVQKLTDKLNSLSPETQQTIVKFAMIAAVVGPVILIFGKLTTKIGKTIKSISNLSKGIKKAGGVMAYLSSPGHKVVLIMTAIALVALLVIKNWDKISATFKKVGDNIAKYTSISGKHVKSFIKIFENVIKKAVSSIAKSVKSLAGKILPPLKEVIKVIATSIKELMPIIKPILIFIAGVFVTGICGAFSIMGTVISAVVNVIGGVVGGLLKVFQGVLNFIIGVFTGNWKQAWEGVKQTFTGVIDILKSLWSGLVDLLTAPVQALVDILDSIFHEKIAGIKNAWDGIKEWLKHPIQGTISLIKNGDLSGIEVNGKNALGTSYWGGGLSLIGEHGPEILELPKGSAVHDANTTKEMLTFKPKVQNTEQQSKSNFKVVIEKLADKIIVREDADIDKIADALVRKLEIQSQNV